MRIAMGFFSKFQKLLRSPIDFPRSLSARTNALLEGSVNQSRLLNEKSNAIIQGLDSQSRMINNRFDALIAAPNSSYRQLARNALLRTISTHFLNLVYKRAAIAGGKR
jgi:hypothetical protein